MKKITILLVSFLFIQQLILSQETVYVGDTELQVREVVDGLDVPWEMKWGPDVMRVMYIMKVLSSEQISFN